MVSVCIDYMCVCLRVCVHVSCASWADNEQLHVACVCVSDSSWPLSLLSGLIVSPPPHSLANRAVTIYLTHTQRHIHI